MEPAINLTFQINLVLTTRHCGSRKQGRDVERGAFDDFGCKNTEHIRIAESS